VAAAPPPAFGRLPTPSIVLVIAMYFVARSVARRAGKGLVSS
jgi:hypothetical protein